MKGGWVAVGVGGILLVAVLGFSSTAVPALFSDAGPAAFASPRSPVGVLTSRWPSGPAPINPPGHGRVYFGAQLAWGSDTPAAYVARLGRRPTIYGDYVRFPLSHTDQNRVMDEARQAAGQGAMLMLALEPMGGLETVTAKTSEDLALTLGQINRTGTPVMVRFGQEMNGSWYPWGQDPSRYRRAFRTVASAVHRLAPQSAMMWAPNYGGGYPFTGGAYPAKPGTRAFTELDTNQDGQLGMNDDPYKPYYPGDTAVDWVGLTLYHWGNKWPWGANEIPERARVRQAITGTYDGSLGDERSIPNFYQEYAVDHHKPFAIAETGALYNLNKAAQNRTTAAEIKSAWWSQVFSSTLHARFPRLRMVLWFEQRKYEKGVTVNTGPVDWRATSDPATAARFRAALPPWFALAGSVPGLSSARLPAELHGSG